MGWVTKGGSDQSTFIVDESNGSTHGPVLNQRVGTAIGLEQRWLRCRLQCALVLHQLKKRHLGPIDCQLAEGHQPQPLGLVPDHKPSDFTIQVLFQHVDPNHLDGYLVISWRSRFMCLSSLPLPPSCYLGNDPTKLPGALKREHGMWVSLILVLLKDPCYIFNIIRGQNIDPVCQRDRVLHRIHGSLSSCRVHLVASIAQQNDSTIKPRLEYFFFQCHLGDKRLIRVINQGSHCSRCLMATTGNGEIANLVAHGSSCFTTPFRVPETVIGL